MLLVSIATVAAVAACLIVALTWKSVGVKRNGRPVVLLLGDSHTQKGTDPAKRGWVSLLQDQYVMTSDVVTRGLPGYNTKWFYKFIAQTIEQEVREGIYSTPALITVWFGSNDAALANGTASRTHVPIEDFKKNLKKIVKKFQSAAPEAEILVITPPHVNDAVRAGFSSWKSGTIDRTNDMATEYARACVEVTEEINVQVLDLNAFFNAMPETTRNGLLDADGLHLNTMGNILVYGSRLPTSSLL
ncbi:isoamyl acetate-hydrolyzing esterase, putative [Phytophthora infestans T30-4]|uniref:Isoamyl acetate-hydrolyzing esterase, putative n=3 Tax=Phytophthora infestans TaxID=4787 RepID=D0NQD3_PHYIT|nr:isoamyl acetate-hydrolyzing esterase, putative [Phytophthora infestans T30-4]EEY62865.1 isoamyl acetate-hydrolyzing esterase, putative [Phytophthora infestans T30-4]KAF4035979.1 GDSL-like Lipase/Acylhydrolase family [Phytophthora infestans]|eukprot:XP_002898740.1 isoamyl acetate-hydrolyzing esterase, putative [Phytophthora infestans T30-4]